MKKFKFNLGDGVMIAVSGERGEVIARAEYKAHPNLYQVRYKSARDEAVEAWWDEDALA